MQSPVKKNWPSLEQIHTIVFDFDGVFTDNKVYVDASGNEWVRCDRGDGLGIDFLRKFQSKWHLKTQLFILSKEENPVVCARARKLKLDCKQGVDDKLNFLKNYLGEKYPNDSKPFEGLVYLGNDLNDLPVIQVAGFSVVPSDAHPKVQELASIVLEQKGGEGFVRGFVENLIRVDQLSLGGIHELVSYR